jgi:hypothetical protein
MCADPHPNAPRYSFGRVAGTAPAGGGRRGPIPPQGFGSFLEGWGMRAKAAPVFMEICAPAFSILVWSLSLCRNARKGAHYDQ